MRRLLLLRHAKSDWADGVSDLDRPLAARGREAAPRMGAYLAENGLKPDLAIVSPAKRTRETWALVEKAVGAVEARFDDRIYEAPPGRLLEVLNEVPDEAKTVLFVGHNPGTQDLARRLIGEGPREDRHRLAAKYPTAGLAVLVFQAARWARAEPGGARLDRFVTPKDLLGGEDDA